MREKTLYFGFIFFSLLGVLVISFPKELNAYENRTNSIQEPEILQEISDINYSGLVLLENCSGFLVNINSNANSPAYIATSGHCTSLEGLPPNKILVNNKKDFRFRFLIGKNQRWIDFKGDHIEYATMKGTDIAIIRLNKPYGELMKKGINGFLVSSTGAHMNDRVIRADVHGMILHKYECIVEHEVHILKEDKWAWTGSYRNDCKSWDGDSGSPLISFKTGQVVGIHNTIQGNGKECLLNNPCEVDEKGIISIHKEKKYSQRIIEIKTCFNKNGEFKLNLETCLLEKP